MTVRRHRWLLLAALTHFVAAGSVSAACPDDVLDPGEQCDDGNLIETDGCTSLCGYGVVCDESALPGGDRFAVDPQSGRCYASFDDDMTTFQTAASACQGIGGHLVTISGASEDAVARSVQNPSQNPWIGATDDAVDVDAVFDWVTGEPFFFTSFAPGEPDDDAAFGGDGECLHLLDASGTWGDTSCEFVGFVTGRICEVPEPGITHGLAAGLLLFLVRRPNLRAPHAPRKTRPIGSLRIGFPFS